MPAISAATASCGLTIPTDWRNDIHGRQSSQSIGFKKKKAHDDILGTSDINYIVSALETDLVSA